MPRVMMYKALLICFALILLAACGTSSSARERQQMMDRWEILVRWNEFEGLIDFIHPDFLAENPITQLDMDRLSQFRVTEYRVRQIVVAPDDSSVERVARIRMYHINSSQERVIDHREQWRYDDQRQVWMLHSGLPDPRQN